MAASRLRKRVMIRLGWVELYSTRLGSVPPLCSFAHFSISLPPACIVLAGASAASSAFVAQLQADPSSIFSSSRFGNNTQSLSIAVGEDVIEIQSSDSPPLDAAREEGDEEDDDKISLGFAELDPPVLISLG